MPTYQIDLDLLKETKKTYKRAVTELEESIEESKRTILAVDPKAYAGMDADSLREHFSAHISGYFTETKDMAEKVGQKLSIAYTTGQLCKKRCYDFIFSLGGAGTVKSMENFGGMLLCDQEKIVSLKSAGKKAMMSADNIRQKSIKANELLSQLQIVKFDAWNYARRIKEGCNEVDKLEEYSNKLTEYAVLVEEMDEAMQRNFGECLPEDYQRTADGVDERQSYIDIEYNAGELERLLKIPEEQLSPEDKAKRDMLIQKLVETENVEEIYRLIKQGYIAEDGTIYIQVNGEMIQYMKTVKDVADWYLGNIDTYCTLGGKGGIPAIHGRAFYWCDLDGNLSGVKVGDDCSSYLWACLVQAGYFTDITPIYNSKNYLPDGDAAKKMEEAGFVWYPLSKMKGEDLREGDVLVRDGHVEIFAYFDGKGIEYAYTWGKIYEEEPARKSANISNITDKYVGIWRLEQ